MKHIRIYEEFIEDDTVLSAEERASYKKRVLQLINDNFDDLKSGDILNIMQILTEGTQPIH